LETKKLKHKHVIEYDSYSKQKVIKTDQDIINRYKSLSTSHLPNLTQLKQRKRVMHNPEFHQKTKLKLEIVQANVCDL